MAPRIFITGVSGYIGGQVLHDITAKHPGYQIRGLVRNEKQQEEITSKYPSVQTVVGTLDSTDILVEEAAQAAVVLQLADADHNSSILSLIRGLSQGSKTRTLIQLSGAASVIDVSSGLGKPTPKIWDDITDLHEISNFDHSHGHAVTDQLAVSAGKEHGVRTAIMIPPTVYGRGEGPIKNASMTIPWLVEAIKKRGKGFTIGEGKNIASVIHIKDVSTAILFLVEHALEPNGGKADWGERGWYYVDGGSFVFADLMHGIAREMCKREMIESGEVDEISSEEGKVLHPWAELLWGANMRVHASRLPGMGWKPMQTDIFETITELIS